MWKPKSFFVRTNTTGSLQAEHVWQWLKVKRSWFTRLCVSHCFKFIRLYLLSARSVQQHNSCFVLQVRCADISHSLQYINIANNGKAIRGISIISSLLWLPWKAPTSHRGSIIDDCCALPLDATQIIASASLSVCPLAEQLQVLQSAAQLCQGEARARQRGVKTEGSGEGNKC